MLLRNYDNIVAGISSVGTGNGFVGDITIFGDGHLNTKSVQGNLSKIDLINSKVLPMSQLYTNTQDYSGRSWIVLGSGTTPVTYDDYKLENELSTSQIVGNSSSGIIGDSVYNEQNKIWTKTLSYDFQAKSDVTVSEIGVIYYANGSNNTKYCLVYREVLDTPISLTTGQYLKVSITTTVSANPNKPTDVSATVETV